MNQGIQPQMLSMDTIGGTYRNPGGTQQAAVPGDPFAMVLMQLLGNREQDSPMAQLLSGLAQEPEEDREAAMELMAQLTLSAGILPAAIPTPEQPLAQTLEQTPQNILSGTAIQTLEPQLAAEALPPRPQQADAPPAIPEGSRTGDPDPKAPFARLLEQPEVLAQPKAAPAEAPAQEAFRFQTAVRQAADQLSTRREPQTRKPPDVEALQAAVEQKQFVPPQNRTLEAAAAQSPPEAREIIPQLSTGILDNLAAGKEEFVIRLKPEGLGEITVKLVEKEGKVLLSILTSSPQVAKALSQDVTSLQQALRPLQAQVQEIAVAESYAATGQQLGQHNQNHRPGQQQWTGQPPRRGHGAFSPDPASDPASTVAAPGIPRALSAYI